MRTLGFIAAITLLGTLPLASCMAPLIGKEAEMHFEAASRFDDAGDYESARNQYAQALMRARVAKADQATISMLTYNYGRTSGYSCHLQDAEKYLLEARELEKGVTGPESAISTMRLFELARFYHDQDRLASSAEYFALGLAAVEKSDVEGHDAIGYADILDEYATVLRSLGRESDASSVATRASAVRARHPGETAHFRPVRYKCAAS